MASEHAHVAEFTVGDNDSVELLRRNVSRKGGLVYNDSSDALLVKYGETCGADDYSIKVAANSAHELAGDYKGPVSAIRPAAAADASVRVTEIA
jgi:hypothetical protein